MSLNEDFIGQNLEKPSWLSTKNFFKNKKYVIDHEKNVKKIKKNPGMGPVPGLKYFYYYFYPKKYFKPRFWASTRVFLIFFYIFFMV